MGKQNREEKNAEKQRKMEEKAKSEKYILRCGKICTWLLTTILCTLICLMVGDFLATSRLRNILITEGFVLAEISMILTAITVWYGYKAFKEYKKESDAKKDLMALLNTSYFKEIELKKQDNQFFNAFLSCKIKAKIHPSNADIVILNFTIVDDNGNESEKTVPFQMQYVKNSIANVKEI